MSFKVFQTMHAIVSHMLTAFKSSGMENASKGRFSCFAALRCHLLLFPRHRSEDSQLQNDARLRKKGCSRLLGQWSQSSLYARDQSPPGARQTLVSDYSGFFFGSLTVLLPGYDRSMASPENRLVDDFTQAPRSGTMYLSDSALEVRISAQYAPDERHAEGFVCFVFHSSKISF